MKIKTLILLAVLPVASLADAPLMVNLPLTITVTNTPCTINSGNAIEVDFGDSILTSSVDGTNNTVKIPINLNCSTATLSASLKLTLSGTASSFDSKVLATSNSALGIKFINTKTTGQVAVNKSIAFNRLIIPVINAILVKDSSADLEAGAFTASAVLQVEYS